MIGILAEKPSAARNFAKALGGMQGTYNGEQYVIVAARGHLYEFQPPEQQVPSYKQWSLSKLPWDEELFNWKRVPIEGTKDTIKQIKSTLSSCDELVGACDLDPTGEGAAIFTEIFQELNLHPKKFSRMYFVDESEKEVRKAFTQRVVIPDLDKYPEYLKAFYRARWDFLSMQFTRIATVCIGGNAVLRQGRLKSAMVLIVGDQLKAISQYKKIPFYMNRFRDENGVVYINPDEPSYKNKDDVPNRYSPSSVTVDSKKKKSSPPPKLIDLATLASLLAPKGFTSDEVLKTYQKMYEAQVVSYPRTEDKFISPEQFNDLLPKIDQIASVVGIDTSLLTHRTPRPTHVKTGGAHGANRPGPNVPNSLNDLTQYGQSAPAIYDLLAKNYLAMLGEDYEYEAQVGHVTDYPDFVGRANVPLSLGYKKIFSDMDEPDEDESMGLGTHADPFIHEGFPPKPQWPTMKWLMRQLEKRDVGTGATRTSIYADVTNSKTKYPLLVDSKGKITMTQFGELSYKLLPGTHIGDLSMTEKLMQQMKEIAQGTLNPEECLKEIQTMVSEDIDTMQANAKNEGIENAAPSEQKEKACGLFNGQQITFTRVWSGHRFTDDEVEALLRGEEITLTGVVGKSGNKFDVKGRLTKQQYNGHDFYGFEKTSFVQGDSPDRYKGVWNGQEISFKRVWGGHTFTDDECQKLLNGEEITVTGLISKSGSTYGVKGKLTKQQYNGHDFVGFERTGFADDGKGSSGDSSKEKYSGKFKGKDVSFNRVWGGHRFTDDECEQLLNGLEITVNGLVSKSGSTYSVKGKLAKQQFNGATFYGFKKTDFA